MEKKITNFFLTGQIRIGKSTIIKQVLKNPLLNNLTTNGFLTKPIVSKNMINGYTAESINGEKRLFAHIDLPTSEKFNRFKVDPLVFENLVQDIDIIHADLILMDEIGIFEKKTDKFINLILQCLDSEKLVLGVYQQRALWFHKLIQNRNDLMIFEITTENRDTIHKQILYQIQKNYF